MNRFADPITLLRPHPFSLSSPCYTNGSQDFFLFTFTFLFFCSVDVVPFQQSCAANHSALSWFCTSSLSFLLVFYYLLICCSLLFLSRSLIPVYFTARCIRASVHCPQFHSQ